MLCPICGKEVGDDIRMCPYCSSSRKPTPKCSKCERELGDSAKEDSPDQLCHLCELEQQLASDQDIEESDESEQTEETNESEKVEETSSPDDESVYVPPSGFAGFWLRLVAWMVDTSIISLIQVAINLVFVAVVAMSFQEWGGKIVEKGLSGSLSMMIVGVVSALVISCFINLVLTLLYNPLFESSGLQATPGKLFFKLRVTDLCGEKISFARSLARNMLRGLFVVPLMVGVSLGIVLGGASGSVKILSVVLVIFAVLSIVILLGTYVAIGITAQKQGIHDIVSNCLVVRAEPLSMGRLWMGILVAVVLFIVIVPLTSSDDKKPESDYTSEQLPVLEGKPVKPPVDISKLKNLSGLMDQGTSQNKQRPRVVPSVKLVYRGNSFQTAFSLWDPERGEVDIGFYTALLTKDDRIRIVKRKHLEAIAENIPPMKLRLVYEPKDATCNMENVRSCQMLFSLHGEMGVVGCSVDELEDGSTALVSELTCDPDTRKLTGRLSGNYVLGSANVYRPADARDISWDFEFETILVDATAEEADWVKQIEGYPSPLAGYVGAVTAEDKRVDLPYALALYSQKYGHLNIGFYGQHLKEAEEQVLKEKKLITYAVNAKQPNLVVLFQFDGPRESLVKEGLVSYTLYFYRDRIGLFRFPGQFGSQSLERTDAAVMDSEIRNLSGKLKDGEVISGFIQGRDSIGIGSQDVSFAWTLKFDAKVLVID